MRLRSTWLLIAALALATCISTGCASTTKISQFDTFAVAGNSYAKAMDGLLDEAERVLIDTNSKKFLWNQRLSLSITDPAVRKQLEATLLSDEEGSGGLLDMDAVIRGNLAAFDFVRSQVAVLAAYFSQLAGLAETDAADRFGVQLAGSVDSINTLSGSLGSTGIGKADGVKQALQALGTNIVRAVQARSLEEELELRGDTIENVLIIHERLLVHLKSQIDADVAVARQREYETKVEEPLVDGRATTDEASMQAWIDDRRRLLRPAPLSEQVSAAIDGILKLRTAWTKLQTDSLGVEDVQAVLDDLQPLIATGEELKE